MEKAKLYFVYGSMGSAKSAALLIKAYNFEEKGLGVFCLKPSIDTRDGENVIKSRIGIERKCTMVNHDNNLYALINIETIDSNINWVMVDEAQFLTKEQVDQLSDVVDFLNINVICYGLKTDFKLNLFEGSKRLLEIADSIQEVKQLCSCGRKAIVNARVDEHGNVLTDGESIEIGGNERYTSLCRKCYKEKIR